jgi:hypothetical protein
MERMEPRMSTRTNKARVAGVMAGLLAWLALAPALEAQTFSEPATIFYGKVVGVGSPQPFPITEGTLRWTIQRADGTEVAMTTTLYAMQDGSYSYRLEVPHAVLGLGLTSVGGVPMPPLPQTHVHKLVTVDGETATLLGPASSSFTTEQLLRTATYRMDLSLGRTALDSDGDGVADWWEDQYGLDKQNPNDVGLDANGDGITALQAYLQGLDPRHDYRQPDVLTRELVVYPAGTTAILLDVKDINSAPSNLVFTLTALPNAGTLTLRNAVANPVAPDAVLAVGAHFSQADLFRGRLVYDHDGSAAQPGSFTVEVRDESSAASTGLVQLLAYEPADFLPAEVPALEVQRIDNHQLALSGRIIMDGGPHLTNLSLATPSAGWSTTGLSTYVASYGNDRPYVLVDGSGHDTLRGGQPNDMLFVGAGDDTLAGGLGADQFIFKSFAGGRKTIEDFRVSESDVIDVSLLPVAPEAYVHQYLRLAVSSGVYRLQVDASGLGTGFTNMSVALPGLTAVEADLYTLIASGRLVVGNLKLLPRITVASTSGQASENGPSEGVFTLTRQGSLAGDLTVSISLAGVAQNGVDYASVLPTVVMPAGQSTVTVSIQPYADSQAEPAESVELIVQAGSGYQVGTANRATLTIEDLLMLVQLEVLEPVAVKDTLTPATFLLTRRDVVNRDVLVRLNIAGTAANGTDYTALPTFLLMPANTTVVLIQVTPKATATLSGGLETVVLSVKTDAAYRVTGYATGQVAIIDRVDSLEAWRSREVPGSTGGLSEFAQSAPDALGVPNLERYAFGVGANVSDPSGLPQPYVHQGRLAVTFRKPLSVRDITYRVSAATNLADWSGSQVPLQETTSPDGSQDPQRVYYVVDPSAASAETIFTTVEVEWLP